MALGAAFRAANLSTAFRVRKVTQSASILIYEIQMEIHTRQHLCCRPLSTAVYSSSFNPKPIVHIETLCDFPFFFFLFFFFYFFLSIIILYCHYSEFYYFYLNKINFVCIIVLKLFIPFLSENFSNDALLMIKCP